jgi:hypothetical protein
MLLDVLDDVFLLDLPLEAPEGFDRLSWILIRPPGYTPLMALLQDRLQSGEYSGYHTDLRNRHVNNN